MGVTAADFKSQMVALLPPGPAFGAEIESVLTAFLSAWAEEFARVSAHADELENEADPRTTSQLLSDYERIFGLPDVCVTIDQTLEQRRAALLSKITMSGGQTKAYFIAIAESLGYLGATIDEFVMYICTSTCNDELNSEADLFAWRINLPFSTGGLFIMDCNSDCTSSLQSWGDEAIECRLNKYKPAHTNVIFAYA